MDCNSALYLYEGDRYINIVDTSVSNLMMSVWKGASSLTKQDLLAAIRKVAGENISQGSVRVEVTVELNSKVIKVQENVHSHECHCLRLSTQVSGD
jgi:hypothetical protein